MVREWLSSRKLMMLLYILISISNIYFLFNGNLLAIISAIFVVMCIYQDYIIFCYNWQEEHPLEHLTMQLKEFNDFLEEQNRKLEEQNKKNDEE